MTDTKRRTTFIQQPLIEEEDDLFSRPTRIDARAQTARITCRVCDARAEVPVLHPALLCPACLADLPATRARVQGWVDAALALLDSNATTWARCAADPLWQPVQRALEAVADGTMAHAQLDRTWATRTAEGGALATLLERYEGYVRECERLSVELTRLDGAMREIEQAEAAHNESLL